MTSDEVTKYTTLGLMIGLSWRTAHEVAESIVADHLAAAYRVGEGQADGQA